MAKQSVREWCSTFGLTSTVGAQHTSTTLSCGEPSASIRTRCQPANEVLTASSTGRYLQVRSGQTGGSEFQRLAEDWKARESASSCLSEIVRHPANQATIRLGEIAIPLILGGLRLEGHDPHPWFPALRAITGEQPVKNEERGVTPEMAQAWIEWGERNGYEW